VQKDFCNKIYAATDVLVAELRGVIADLRIAITGVHRQNGWRCPLRNPTPLEALDGVNA
jgi:hypothetical protein